MSNQQRLKEYLVGENGYLKNDISNGKVIMLSGKWGSGKTHFWQNEVATEELKKELVKKNESYSYISLYGKSSIEEIENDIFGQIFFDAIGGENIVTKTFSTFTKYSKRYGNLFSTFDFSKLADGLNEEQKENKERIALERLKNGGLVCFDDFERKSKDIDLNDLFGFITQLTLNFNCKVVIILNDNVFEGKEKDIFSNVKEKTVSKFLKYEPSIRDLFKSIFFQKNKENKFKYSELREYNKVILKTIEETKELNARIYIQILDNLVEWIEKKQEINNNILRCLILVNINFVLNHYVFSYDINDKSWFLPNLFKESNITVNILKKLNNFVKTKKDESFSNKLELIDILKQISHDKDYTEIKNKEELNCVTTNSNLIWQFWKLEINLNYRENILLK